MKSTNRILFTIVAVCGFLTSGCYVYKAEVYSGINQEMVDRLKMSEKNLIIHKGWQLESPAWYAGAINLDSIEGKALISLNAPYVLAGVNTNTKSYKRDESTIEREAHLFIHPDKFSVPPGSPILVDQIDIMLQAYSLDEARLEKQKAKTGGLICLSVFILLISLAALLP